MIGEKHFSALTGCGVMVSVLLGSATTCATQLVEGDWSDNGHDWQQDYYSPLAQINVSNIKTLGRAWEYDLKTTHGIEATPLVVKGVMYASAPWGMVHSLDARTGKELWSFDPHVDGRIASKVCCGVVNRGLSVDRGRVFVAALDGRLFALDAHTGKVLWQVDTIIDHRRNYAITSGTYVTKDVVVVGNSGADSDARGYVSAYVLGSGKLRWRFFTVPASSRGPFENPELKAAARTWDPHSRWEVGLGGTVWGGMAYDANLNLLYFGTSNGLVYNHRLRSPAGGDNLFLSSILAINPDTGRLSWHYQEVPGEQWDYDASTNIILADLRVDGRSRKVLLQAGKDGFFYVLDRANGQVIHARPFVKTTWAERVDEVTGRPVALVQGDYSNEPRLVFPSFAGGHNWQPMSFDPQTGLVYIPTIEAGIVLWMPQRPFTYELGGINMGLDWAWPVLQGGKWSWGMDSPDTAELPPWSELAKSQPDATARGFLRAWDPVANRVVWQVETSDQWAGQTNAMWNGGGIMTTAGGLVFQGRSSGFLHVYRADSGEQLAAFNVGTSIMAAPMTYQVDGVQYVAVMAGFGGALGSEYPKGTAAYRYGNAGRILVFKLGGDEFILPEAVVRTEEFSRPALSRSGTAEIIERGQRLFENHCIVCHWNKAAAGAVPDLRRMSADTHAKFEHIVLGGSRAANGMGSFRSTLDSADVAAIHAYLVDAAWREYEAGPK